MRILLVEDDRPVADTLALLLGVDRHRVDAAADGVEALERLQQGSYDVILCDVRMPRLDGPGLYARVLAECPELAPRIGFVTATYDEPTTQEFFARTGVPWIEKPAALDDLRRLLDRLTSR